MKFKKIALFALTAALSATQFAQAQPARRPAAQPVPAPNGMTAAPDAQMTAVLDRLSALKPLPIETLSAGEARYQPAFPDAVKKLVQELQMGVYPQPEPVGKVVDTAIPNGANAIAIRVYTPPGANASKPLPIIIYYHGGGWVIASINAYDNSARALSNGTNSIVISVEYRKGPENKFPAAHDDAFAAYQYIAQNAASFGGDARRIAVVGESAGGNLACNVAIQARDRKIQAPLQQVLVYPIANNDLNAPSVRENTSPRLTLRASMLPWFLQNYLNNQAESGDPRIALVKANLRGLPPTLIINAQIDPLRSEGELLAERMRAAGVTVEQTTYPNVVHEFFGMAAVSDQARAANAQAFTSLNRAFGNK